MRKSMASGGGKILLEKEGGETDGKIAATGASRASGQEEEEARANDSSSD